LDGRIAVDGLYDRVRLHGPAERAFMARTGPPDGEILRTAGVSAPWGERGYSAYERTTIRPALTVNGLGGGHAGPGGKGVIPSSAWAKVGLRLVADQDPAEVRELLVRHLRERLPRGVSLTVRQHLAVPPVEIGRE